jgi:tetratricopeptide (TPR) repeat protein
MKQLFLCIFLGFLLMACSSKKELVDNGINLAKSNDKEIAFNFLEGVREKMIGNYGKAEVLFKKVVDKDPTNDAAYFELAKIQAKSEQIDNALVNAEKAIKLDSQNRYYYYLKSELYQTNKQTSESIKVLERALKVFPEDVELYYEIASKHIAIQNWSKARKTYATALKKFGDNPEVTIQIIKIQLEEKNFSDAEFAANELIEKFPKETLYLELLGEIMLSQNKMDQAQQYYEKVLQIDPFIGYTHFVLGDIYLSQGLDKKAFVAVKNGFLSPNVDIDGKIKILMNYYEVTAQKPQYLPDAFELCELLIKVHQNDAKGYAIFGDFLLRSNKIARARTMFKEAVKIAPDKYLIWNQIIVLDAQLNDREALLADTEKAITLFPNMPDFFLYRGIALAQNKQYEDAVDVLEAGKGIVVDNDLMKAQFHANLGDIYHELLLHEKSDLAYDNCLLLNPKNAFVLNNYSYYLSLRKTKLELAESMSKKAIELEPNQASFLDTYGWILYQLKKYDEAKKYLDQALDFGGISSGTILEHYGDVLFQLNDVDGALEYWKKALELGDGSKLLQQKIIEKKLYE